MKLLKVDLLTSSEVTSWKCSEQDNLIACFIPKSISYEVPLHSSRYSILFQILNMQVNLIVGFYNQLASTYRIFSVVIRQAISKEEEMHNLIPALWFREYMKYEKDALGRPSIT